MGNGWYPVGGKIKISGQFTNKSAAPLTDVRIQLRYSANRIFSRGAFSQEPSAQSQTPGENVPVHGTVAPGATVPWTLTFNTAGRTGLAESGAHAMSLLAQDSSGRSLAEQQTYLVMVGKDFGKTHKKTSVGWVWPLIDKPHRAADSPFLDDQLNSEFAATGRLGKLVAAAKGTKTPITWSVDPALLQDASALSSTKGYQVTAGSGTTHKPSSQSAANWLNDVKSFADPYFTVPYSDLDSVALVRNGMTGQLTSAVTKGKAAAQDLIGASRNTQDFAWPVAGAINSSTLNALAAQDPGQYFLLSSGNLASTVSGQRYTPDAAASIKTSHGARTGIAYDATLSSAISGDSSTDTGRILTVQRFLAETSVLDDELPTTGRTLVVAPARQWNPGQATASTLLAVTRSAPWLKAAALTDIAKQKSSQRELASYTTAERRQELPKSYLAGIGRGAKRVQGLKDVISRTGALSGMITTPPGTGNSNPFDQFAYGGFRAASSAWRGNQPAAAAFLKRLGGQVDGTAGNVKISATKQAALAGRTGVLPVSILNGFANDSVKVQVRITSLNPNRLQISPNRRSFTLPISPGRNPTVKIPMQSTANGVTTVKIELYTPDGKTPIGAPALMEVKTSGFVLTALLITGGGLVILFVGVGIRATRARKRRNLAEARAMTEGDDGGPVGD